MKTVFPAVALGRGVDEPRQDRVIQREHLVFRRLRQEQRLHLLELVGIPRGEVVVLREVFGDVVELPLVVVDVGQLGRSHGPRRRGRRRAGIPAVVIDAAIGEHLEILRARASTAHWHSPCRTCTPCSRLRWAFARCRRPSPAPRYRWLRGSSARCRSCDGTACGCRRRP